MYFDYELMKVIPETHRAH